MPSGYYNANIPAGPIGVIASDDPSGSGSYGVRKYQGVNQGESQPWNHQQRERAWMRLSGQRVKLRARFSKAAAHRRLGKFAREQLL